jgi:hypothetical protein
VKKKKLYILIAVLTSITFFIIGTLYIKSENLKLNNENLLLSNKYQEYKNDSEKEFNKLKRLDPQKYIIDAGDIDWGGFSICSYLYDNNNIQTPNNIDINTTYGMLKTLVDLISNLQVRVSNLEKYTVWNPE